MDRSLRPGALRALSCALIVACASEPNAPVGGGTGAIRVTVSMTGVDLARTYDVLVSGRTTGASHDAAATIADLQPGLHNVLLRVATNCQVDGSNPRAASVVAGDTAHVAFVVTCTAATGSVRVTTATSGIDIDPNGYRVRVTGSTVTGDYYERSSAVGVAETVTLAGVPTGNVTVTLRGLSVNCDAVGANPRTVAVVAADVVTVAFDATCTAATSQLAYVATFLDGRSDIHLIDGDGIGDKALTSDPASEDDPAWSPDGRRIAFTANRDGNREIYVIDADGSNPVRLTDAPTADYHPCWSPDGERIAFVSERDGNAEIYVMHANGTNPVRLTSHGARDTDPAWSPDGRRIAFTSERASLMAEVYVMDVTGSEPVRVTMLGGQHPAWSPDGTRLAYSATLCPWYAYTCYPGILVKTGVNEPVLLPFAFGERPAWSPDGRKIAYDAFSCDFYFYECQAVGLRIARVDGTDVLAEVAVGSNASWRP